ALAGQAPAHGRKGRRRQLRDQTLQRNRTARHDPRITCGARLREVLNRMPAMTIDAAAASLPPMSGDFVLLGSGALQLLLPQSDVGAGEHPGRRPRPSGQPGLVEIDAADGQAFFVVALSPRMEPMAEFPEGRFVLTSFPGHAGLMVCWD